MRVNKRSLSYLILDLLEKSVDGYVRFEDFVYNSKLYAFYGRGMQPLPRSSFSKAINRLKEGGLVESVKIDNQLIFKLTHQGEQFLLENFDKDFKWDGKWRIVMFDIPEQKRLVRDLFRRNLKKWGFLPIQKSVWVSKKNFFDKLTEYTKALGIESWVAVIESDKVSSFPKT